MQGGKEAQRQEGKQPGSRQESRKAGKQARQGMSGHTDKGGTNRHRGRGTERLSKYSIVGLFRKEARCQASWQSSKK